MPFFNVETIIPIQMSKYTDLYGRPTYFLTNTIKNTVIVLERIVEIDYHSLAGQVFSICRCLIGRMCFARANILPLLYSLTMIPPKTGLVKCKYICALSALSSFWMVMIICNFFLVLGENFLRIYTRASRNAPEKKTDRRKGVASIINVKLGSRRL